MTTQEQMERLADHIGELVEVEWVFDGALRRDQGELREVAPFLNCLIGCSGIPFIGYGSAIRRIWIATDGEDEVLFFNPAIRADYGLRNDSDARDALVRESFGDFIASSQKAERERAKSEQEQRFAELDQRAKDNAPRLIEAGVALVSAGLVENWREYAETNTQDGCSAAVIEGTVQAMQALADGKTPAEAERAAVAAETGFQMGCVAKGVAHFSPRGEEFRKYWNRQYMSEERAAMVDESGGVVNPAVLTIGGDHA